MKLNNYLIIRNDGIGDLIISIPLIEKLKEKKGTLLYLVCSSRNIEFAKHLKEMGLIDQIICFTGKIKSKYSYYNYVKKILKSIQFEDIFILKPSITNLLISISLRRKKIYSLIALNESNIFKINKYSPPIFLSLFLEKYELIDCRNDYKNSASTHMARHYLNLYNLSHSKPKEEKINIIKTNKINRFSKKSNIYLRQIKNLINYKNNNRIILFHFDEKWDRSILSIKEFKIFFENLFNFSKSTIIVTKGLASNRYEKLFLKTSKLKKLKTNLYSSIKIENLFFVKKSSYSELSSILSISDIVVTPHGGLSHSSALFGKKLIDLIEKDRKAFYKKWLPLGKKMKQFDINDTEQILKTLKKF